MKRTCRAGFTVIECCAAAAMLVATLAVVVSLLSAVARKRQAVVWQAYAMLEADNLLERLTAEPYAALTTEYVDAMKLDPDIAGRLPQGSVAVHLTEETVPPGRKRIEVEIAWQAPHSAKSQRQRVVTWVYAQEGRP